MVSDPEEDVRATTEKCHHMMLKEKFHLILIVMAVMAMKGKMPLFSADLEAA